MSHDIDIVIHKSFHLFCIEVYFEYCKYLINVTVKDANYNLITWPRTLINVGITI